MNDFYILLVGVVFQPSIFYSLGLMYPMYPALGVKFLWPEWIRSSSQLSDDPISKLPGEMVSQQSFYWTSHSFFE